MFQMKLGYVIPEWPGQTHLWIWREISHLREWGVPIRIFSTRRPEARYRGKHAFSDIAEAETTYLWPLPWYKALWMLLVSFLLAPIGFLRCIALAFRLPLDQKPAWKTVLPLILPACHLAREVRRDGITHLHSHTPANCAIIAMMVKRLTGVPFSQIVNANIEWWGGAMTEKFADAAFTLFVTQWMVDQMKSEFSSIPPQRYGLGRVGVDTRRWTPVPHPTAPPSAPLKVLSVGRLTPSKGHDQLMRAIAIVKNEGRAIALRIGGDGPEKEKLTALAKELNIENDVTFLGSISEETYLEEMRATDVFVLASHCEPMGVVYMEAMAIERPTIGTSAGGVGEIITDGVDGLLVPPRDPPAIAAALRRLIDDPDLRTRLGTAGRKRIVEHFDSRLWADVLLKRIQETHAATPTLQPNTATA